MPTPKQNMITSRSFGQLIGSLFDLQEAIRVHVSRGAEKLRYQQLPVQFCFFENQSFS